MGEIAEDMIDGVACSMCGQYFENPDKPNEQYSHGIPVVCWSCWKELTPNERQLQTRAEVDIIKS